MKEGHVRFVADKMLKSYREIYEILDSLLDCCNGERLTEVIFEIQRAKLICQAGTNYSFNREEHQRNYEKLKYYQGLINKLAFENIRERKIRKLIEMLDDSINRLKKETVHQSQLLSK